MWDMNRESKVVPRDESRAFCAKLTSANLEAAVKSMYSTVVLIFLVLQRYPAIYCLEPCQ